MGRADVVDGVGGERASDHLGVVAAAALAGGQAASTICSRLLRPPLPASGLAGMPDVPVLSIGEGR
jgi:hypothetical protein